MTTVEVPERPGEVEVVASFATSPLGEAPGAAPDGELCRVLGFDAALDAAVVLGRRGPGQPVEVVAGLGPAALVDAEAIRRAAAAAVRATPRASSLRLELAGVDPPELSSEEVAQAACEGALLAAYRFERYKSERQGSPLERVELAGVDPGPGRRGASRAEVVAGVVTLARDLVNTPAGELTPRRFEELARELAALEGLGIRVLDEQAIVEERLGGLLAVSRGSAEPPRLVRLEHAPGAVAGSPPVALVGKGITFDSGGLSLKSGTSMMTMKTDMSGAAAVLAALVGSARLGIGVHAVGWMALTENMPGGRATKPGDVLRARNGKTIEVLNTDAEGRLVLADALSLAAEESPDSIVDLATLTGACITALGRGVAGLMGNDDRLLAALRAAGRRAGEAVWHLPLPSGYRSQIESEVADMKNIGAPGEAGALAAGLLLEEFVGTTPWAHLDIAGPARSETDGGYRHKGGTGFGVRTLLELLARYEPLGGRAEGLSTGTEVLR